MVKLIIFDLYGTIIRADARGKIVRPGFQEFLEHYKNLKKVLFTIVILKGFFTQSMPILRIWFWIN